MTGHGQSAERSAAGSDGRLNSRAGSGNQRGNGGRHGSSKPLFMLCLQGFSNSRCHSSHPPPHPRFLCPSTLAHSRSPMRAQATRNACFAIISAIEHDLRAVVRHAADSLNLSTLLPDDVRDAATRRWQRDVAADARSAIDDDLDLLNYIDFLDLTKTISKSLRAHQSVLALDLTFFSAAFDSLAPTRNRVCHTRPLEIDDLPTTLDVAERLLATHGPSFPTLDRTLHTLRDDAPSLLSAPVPAFWAPETDIHHNLPLPEFDDTGFFGRDRDRKEVHRLLKSHYPVVTIVGEGGVGKTALAQKCLYDLLDEPVPAYDLIVWVSLKTRTLTAAGVRDISHSITSVLGLLGSIAGNLGTPDTTNLAVSSLVEEITEYLGVYRVLIAIDNLETLRGDNLRSLLVGIPSESKLLITSRIGLGEFETRYSLNPLDQHTAAALMRRFARFLSLETIFKAPREAIAKYCDALFHNPLLIKWFVATVGRGAEPARLLHQRGTSFQDALQFCCSRLFDQLSSTEWTVTHTLTAARRPLTFTELQFLCADSTTTEIESALSALHNSSLLKRDTLPSGTLTYRVSESAAAYVSSTRPPNKDAYRRVTTKLRSLRHLSEKEQVAQAHFEFEVFSIRTNSRDERIAAVDLRRALDSLRRNDVDGARSSVARAKHLMPDYAEAYRVSSLVEARAQEPFRAAEELDLAVQYDPESPIVRYTYALFLLRETEDAEAALEQLEVALASRPDEAALLGVRALALTRLGRYTEASTLYEGLLSSVGQRPRRWRISTRDQAAECYRRWAEADSENRDGQQFRVHIEEAFGILADAVAADDYDENTGYRIGRVLNDAVRHATWQGEESYASETIARAEEIAARLPERRLTVKKFDRLRTVLEPYPDLLDRIEALCAGGPSRNDVGTLETTGAADGKSAELRGTVAKLLRVRRFGFIETEGERWFFHYRHLANRAQWARLDVGASVAFRIGSNEKGPCAVRVRLVPATRHDESDNG